MVWDADELTAIFCDASSDRVEVCTLTGVAQFSDDFGKAVFITSLLLCSLPRRITGSKVLENIGIWVLVQLVSSIALGIGCGAI